MMSLTSCKTDKPSFLRLGEKSCQNVGCDNTFALPAPHSMVSVHAIPPRFTLLCGVEIDDSYAETQSHCISLSKNALRLKKVEHRLVGLKIAHPTQTVQACLVAWPSSPGHARKIAHTDEQPYNVIPRVVLCSNEYGRMILYAAPVVK